MYPHHSATVVEGHVEYKISNFLVPSKFDASQHTRGLESSA